MFPTLFSIGPFTLYTFNLAVFLAFVSGGFVFWKRAHEEHYEDDEIFDVGLLSILSGLVASRIGYVIFHINDFGLQPLQWLSFFGRPGLHEAIGIVVGLWTLGLLAKRRKWDHFELMDYAVVGISMFVILLWIGRFLAGSQIGTPTGLPIGLRFPNTFDLRHPLQLYMAALGIVTFVSLRALERRYRFFQWYRANKQSAQSGFVVAVFFMLYGLWGSVTTPLRMTDARIAGISIDLIVFVGMILVGGALLYIRSGHMHLPKKPVSSKSSIQQRVRLSPIQRMVRRRG